jgi:DNA-binding MarR family transcriptional regulator
MASKSFPLEHSLGFILSDISRLARREFDRRVRHLGVTRAQWLVLLHLARQPGCTQSDLAEAMQIQKITVSRHVDRLVRARWIDRRDHAADGRAYRLFVSRQAQPIIRQLTAVADRLREEYMTGLSRPRRTALMTDLLLIKSNLVRLDANARQRPHESN